VLTSRFVSLWISGWSLSARDTVEADNFNSLAIFLIVACFICRFTCKRLRARLKNKKN
jgi:hypothetical protein